MLVLNPILLAGVASAGVVRRATTGQNLQTIDTDTRALLKAEQGYNGGGIFAALPIKNAADKVDQDIKSATSDANSNGPVSEADAQSAIDFVNTTLEPDVAAAINELINKKAQVQKDGLTGIVNDELKTLQTDTKTYGVALGKITPADKQSAASAALAKVDADFQRGINAYAS